MLARIWPSSPFPSQSSSDVLEPRVMDVNTSLNSNSRSWDDLVQTSSVFASRLQGGQKIVGMRFQSSWPSCLPTGFGFLPSCSGMEVGPSALAAGEVGSPRKGPQGSNESWTKASHSSIQSPPARTAFYPVCPRFSLPSNCLPCVTLAAIFFPLWCLPCQIFKGSYHVSLAKLHTFKVFSSFLINLGLTALNTYPYMLCTVCFGSGLGSTRIFLFKIIGTSVHFVSLLQTYSQGELGRHDSAHYGFKYSPGPFSPPPPDDISLKLNLKHGQKSTMTSVSITLKLIKYEGCFWRLKKSKYNNKREKTNGTAVNCKSHGVRVVYIPRPLMSVLESHYCDPGDFPEMLWFFSWIHFTIENSTRRK